MYIDVKESVKLVWQKQKQKLAAGECIFLSNRKFPKIELQSILFALFKWKC